MKKLLFTFLLISAFFSAQNRFIYDYKFVTDRADIMYVDKNGNTEISGIKEMDLMPSPKTKIYINGKLSTKEEMEKLNPNDIATVNVNKNVNNGKEEGEIRIQTK
jgi:hypothetical protein